MAQLTTFILPASVQTSNIVKGDGPVLNLMSDVFDELDLYNYYAYLGSYTTPPCNQAG